MVDAKARKNFNLNVNLIEAHCMDVQNCSVSPRKLKICKHNKIALSAKVLFF